MNTQSTISNSHTPDNSPALPSVTNSTQVLLRQNGYEILFGLNAPSSCVKLDDRNYIHQVMLTPNAAKQLLKVLTTAIRRNQNINKIQKISLSQDAKARMQMLVKMHEQTSLRRLTSQSKKVFNSSS